MNHLLRAGALALACLLLPGVAAAQGAVGKPIVAPLLTSIPAQAIYCDDGTGKAALCALGGGGGSGGPTRATSTPAGGTVATANAYQTALASSPTRLGCAIQNTSTTTLRIGVGSSPADASAFQIAPGGSFSCSSPGGLVLTDQISVAASAAGASYVVVSQ